MTPDCCVQVSVYVDDFCQFLPPSKPTL